MPEQMPFSLEPRRVYALLVGIDAYPAEAMWAGRVAFAPLRGCVADVAALKHWLEERPGLRTEALTLTNAQATKEAIAQGIMGHLGQARAGDTALLYFSGHGALEAADPQLWPTETDERLESVVCHVSDGQSPTDWLLTDKELRWLVGRLWEKTQAHITLVFDCCHSGDNTRSERAAPKRAYPGVIFPKRAWSDFLFAASLDASDAATRPIDEALPPGRYVHLSASERNEAAVEVAGRGVFTQALLEALSIDGALPDYRQLYGQVRQRLLHRYSQRPRLYAPEADDTGLAFLGGAPADVAGWTRMVYQPAGDGHYVVLAGAAHGVCAGYTEVWAELGPGQAPLRGMAEEALLNETRVRWSEADAAQLGQAPRQVRLKGTHRVELKVYLDGTEANFESLMAGWPANWRLCDEVQTAQYALCAREGWWWVAAPADANRPLAKPLRAGDSESVATLRRYLSQIERYHFLRDELRPGAGQLLPESALGIEAMVYAAGGETAEPLIRTTAGWALAYEPLAPMGGTRELGIALTNLGQEDMYVAAIIYGFDFSVNPTYLLPTTTMLEPGERKWLRDHKSVRIKLAQDPRMYWYRWPSASDTIQFVIGNAPFDLSWTKMEGLPGPFVPGSRLRAGRDGLPGWADRLRGTRWNVINVPLTLSNPWYDVMPPADSYVPMSGAPSAWWALWA